MPGTSNTDPHSRKKKTQMICRLVGVSSREKHIHTVLLGSNICGLFTSNSIHDVQRTLAATSQVNHDHATITPRSQLSDPVSECTLSLQLHKTDNFSFKSSEVEIKSYVIQVHCTYRNASLQKHDIHDVRQRQPPIHDMA